MTTHSSILAWRIPMEKGAWWAAVHGVSWSQTDMTEATMHTHTVIYTLLKSFPGGSDDKESTCNAGDPGLISGSRRSSGKGNGNTLQYSCCENPMHRGALWTTVNGVARSWTGLSD